MGSHTRRSKYDCQKFYRKCFARCLGWNPSCRISTGSTLVNGITIPRRAARLLLVVPALKPSHHWFLRLYVQQTLNQRFPPAGLHQESHTQKMMTSLWSHYGESATMIPCVAAALVPTAHLIKAPRAPNLESLKFAGFVSSLLVRLLTTALGMAMLANGAARPATRSV